MVLSAAMPVVLRAVKFVTESAANATATQAEVLRQLPGAISAQVRADVREELDRRFDPRSSGAYPIVQAATPIPPPPAGGA